jgi:proline dehydrogenase
MPRTWWSPLARRAAQAYVAGPALEDALAACRRVAGHGFASTIGFWNGNRQEPEEVAGAYVDALGALGQDTLDCYLSVKALPLDFSRALSAEIVERARQEGVRVHFDSLGPDTVEATFAMIEEGLARHQRLGCTIPGRWRRSPSDALRAADLGLNVRVVKGQFSDMGRTEVDPRSGFLAVVDRLAGCARFVAVATHDAALARMALGRLKAAGTPCELELLFGLPLWRATRVAREVGVGMRMYVPYGHAWLPYRLSEARRNPGLLWWLARDLVAGRSLSLARPLGVAGQPVAAQPRR